MVAAHPIAERVSAREALRGAYQQPVPELAVVVPAAPTDVPGPCAVAVAPAELPSVVPLPPGVLPVPDAPSVLVEPARSRVVALPVEVEAPSGVLVPVVPDRLPPVAPAAPSEVVPGVPVALAVFGQGVVEPELLIAPVELPMEPGLVVELELPTEPGLVADPDEVWASARPVPLANADAVTSIANFFLLAFMFKLLGG